MALAGHRKGGPAKVAVISSGLMGSINGAAVANVVSTGAFTIPLTKKLGYQKNLAGAVEASATVGGQVVPPIMGASAFSMAETSAVESGRIALAALIPAVVCYLVVIMLVLILAGLRELKGVPEAALPRIRGVRDGRGHLMIPLVVLVVSALRD